LTYRGFFFSSKKQIPGAQNGKYYHLWCKLWGV